MKQPANPKVAVPSSARHDLARAWSELRRHLDEGIVPFWADRAIDSDHGGYLTRFDEHGSSRGTPEKYLNTQCRLLWWFSALARRRPRAGEFAKLAHAGFEFITRHFLDREKGGWRWTVRADGSPLDDGKIVYGQSFALYALAEYGSAVGDPRALALARETFDLLQAHCADPLRGGYLENLGRDWAPEPAGFSGGDRKSLDTHMHLMESFTALLAATGEELHRRKLLEVTALIFDRMVDPATGCGRNQFDLRLNPIPAIAIRRTWNAERAGARTEVPTDTTSYGHNTELAWLTRRALEVAGGEIGTYRRPILRLLEHALHQGIDRELGGVYRDGTAGGGPLVLEKEFWQHAEILVGLLDGFELSGEPRYLEAFLLVWNFVRDRFIAPCGEWRVLLDRAGAPIDANVGNEWKVAYHTGRAMLECTERLERMLEPARPGT